MQINEDSCTFIQVHLKTDSRPTDADKPVTFISYKLNKILCQVATMTKYLKSQNAWFNGTSHVIVYSFHTVN